MNFQAFCLSVVDFVPFVPLFSFESLQNNFFFWIFLFELMILLQSEMPTLPPFKITNIGPSFKILFSVFQLLETLFKSHSLSTAPLSALKYGLPWWLSDKESCQCRRCGFDSWVGEMAWRRKWQPTPVFLPGNSLYRGAWWVTVHGVTKSWTQLSDGTTTTAALK